MLTGEWVYKRFKEGSYDYGYQSPDWEDLTTAAQDDWQWTADRIASRAREDNALRLVVYLSSNFSEGMWINADEASRRLWTREAAAVRKEVFRADG